VEAQHKLTPCTRSLVRLAPPDKETLEVMDSTGTALFNLRAVEVVRGPQGKRQTNPWISLAMEAPGVHRLLLVLQSHTPGVAVEVRALDLYPELLAPVAVDAEGEATVRSLRETELPTPAVAVAVELSSQALEVQVL